MRCPVALKSAGKDGLSLFTLADVSKTHQRMEDGLNTGKLC
jgi:hypothetical protein